MTLLAQLRALVKSPTTYILIALAVEDVVLHGLFSMQDRQSLHPVIDLLTLCVAVVSFLAVHGKQGDNWRVGLDSSMRLMNAALERRVLKRTSELAAANEALARENVERTRIERRLAEEVTQDALTGIANRRRFLSLVDEMLESSVVKRHAIVFIDVDHFKLINDGLGHALGDRALIAIADRLSPALSDVAVVGRVGGDEFAVASPVDDREQAEAIAERILAVLKNPIAIGDRVVHCSVSIGVRFSDCDGDNAAALLRDAHTAMNRAKVRGRSRYVIFDAQMQTDVEQRFTLNLDLRQAIEHDQFFVEYQPIFSLVDGRTTGYEALVRWAHPQRGRIEPGVFIPAAEDSGLVVAIGSAVLHEVCAEIAKRKITPLTPVGINLSARQIEQPNIVEYIQKAIFDSKIAPESIMLEVTESVFVENLQAARDVLSELKQMGILIAIDDFGTGYSSLSYLQELPFDVLKIDRSFTRRVNEEATSRDIVRMLVTLAESLHMSVVAEGIETEEQLLWIRNVGCRKGQGYLFSRPLPPDQAFALPALAAGVFA